MKETSSSAVLHIETGLDLSTTSKAINSPIYSSGVGIQRISVDDQFLINSDSDSDSDDLNSANKSRQSNISPTRKTTQSIVGAIDPNDLQITFEHDATSAKHTETSSTYNTEQSFNMAEDNDKEDEEEDEDKEDEEEDENEINARIKEGKLLQASISARLQEEVELNRALLLSIRHSSGSSNSNADITPDEDSISAIVGMGFEREQAISALRSSRNDLQGALNRLLD